MKEKPKFKKGEKVCINCGKAIDKKNQNQPWFSLQTKAKDRYANGLLDEIKLLRSKLPSDEVQASLERENTLEVTMDSE